MVLSSYTRLPVMPHPPDWIGNVHMMPGSECQLPPLGFCRGLARLTFHSMGRSYNYPHTFSFQEIVGSVIVAFIFVDMVHFVQVVGD